MTGGPAFRLCGVALAAAVASSCRRADREPPLPSAGGAESTGRVAAAPAAVRASAPPGEAAGSGPLVGDTLDLANIGRRRLPDGSPGNGRCTAAETPAAERLIFDDDSMYSGLTVARPRCWRDTLPDTTRWRALYQLHGDTLTLFREVAEGWEQIFNGRLGEAGGGLWQIDVEPELRRFYLRRQAPHRLVLPRRLLGHCEGEDCRYGFRVVACADLPLKSADSLGAPVVASLRNGDTATAVTGSVWVLAPGLVVMRRDYVLANDEGEEGPIPRDDTLKFQAGDTVFVLEYFELGGWAWWYRGRLSAGDEFWDGPSEHAFGPADAALPGHSLSESRRDHWLKLRGRGGAEGWWRSEDGRLAFPDEGEHCPSSENGDRLIPGGRYGERGFPVEERGQGGHRLRHGARDHDLVDGE